MEKEKVLLIGMPGSGKTVVGKLLAKELNYKFYDMDRYIENSSGNSIPELFKISEDYFRDWESKACMELSKKKRIIISSGGGVVKRKKNIDLFKEDSIIIFIDRPIKNIIGDIDTRTRPLLSEGKERIYNLHEERYTLYNKYCDIRVVNEGFIKDLVIEVKNRIKIAMKN